MNRLLPGRPTGDGWFGCVIMVFTAAGVLGIGFLTGAWPIGAICAVVAMGLAGLVLRENCHSSATDASSLDSGNSGVSYKKDTP
jgi:hypothetical protein